MADSLIRRLLAENRDPDSLATALNTANPFGDSQHGRQLWLDALLRHAAKLDKEAARSKPS